MKSSKLFLTSLLAAAAMSATAYASGLGGATETIDGTTATVSGTYTYNANNATGYTPTDASVTKVVFNGFTGLLEPWVGGVFAYDIELTNSGTTAAYTVNNGSSDGYIAFSGALTGTGTFTTNNGNPGKYSDWIFTGNIQGFNGAFNLNNATMNTGDKGIGASGSSEGILQFGGTVSGSTPSFSDTATSYSSAATVSDDGIVHNISGTNQSTISTASVLRYSYTGGANGETLGIDNASISARYLEFKGGANYTVSSTVTGNNTTAANNTLKISAGTTTFTGTVSNFGNVTVASGATLAVGTAGSLDLSGATFTGNGGTFALNGGKVVFGNVSLLGDTALLSASTITATSGTVEFSGAIKNGTYTIFTGTDSASLVESGISLTGTVNSGYTQAWAKDGNNITVTISNAARDLVWSGATNTTWDTASANWKTSAEATESTTFNTYDYVTFNGDATVTVADGGVTAGAVNVTSGTLTLASGGGKVTAVEGFAVGDGATLKLMSENQISGTVKVNSGGVFELNGHAKEIGSNGLSDVILNGGTLQNSLATTGIDSTGYNQQQLYKITLTANSSVVATQTFGLVSSEYGESTLNLGANTLTKSGAGSFMLVNTTISGNGGVLDVTEGLIAGKPDKYLRLGEGVTLKTSGTGGATNIKIASMAANSKLILGGSTPSTVALNSFALGAGALIDVSGGNAVTGTISSMGANSSLTLNGTAASTVAITGAVGGSAGKATINISNGNRVNYNSTAQNSLCADISISGAGSTFTQATGQDMLKTGADLFISVSDGGTLALGAARWEISSTTIELDGGNITGTYNVTDSKNYGNLDFGAATNTVNVMQTHGQDSTISASIRLRGGKTVTFNVAENATLNITGQLSAGGTFVKDGAGTVTFDMPSTAVSFQEAFTGGVNIDAGKVVVKNSAVFGKTTAATTRAITVAGNAALQINLAGGALDVGTTGVTFAAGSKFLIDLTGVSVEENTALTIISSSAISFNSIETGSLTSDIIESYFDAGNSVLGDYSTWLREWSYDTTNGLQLTMTIPEPSVFGLLAGLGALALAGTRRRRRKA